MHAPSAHFSVFHRRLVFPGNEFGNGFLQLQYGKKDAGLIVLFKNRAVLGIKRRDLIGKRISPQLEQIMEDRGIYRAVPSERSVFVTESLDRYCATIAAPIISEGDALGLVVFIGTEGESAAGETEYKLAQAIAGFLGKHMES